MTKWEFCATFVLPFVITEAVDLTKLLSLAGCSSKQMFAIASVENQKWPLEDCVGHHIHSDTVSPL